GSIALKDARATREEAGAGETKRASRCARPLLVALFVTPFVARPRGPPRSLDLGFLVDHVLAGDRIELPDLHLLRHVPLVLVGGVEMAGSGRRLELDLLAHGDPPRRGSWAGRGLRRPGRAGAVPRAPPRCPSCRSGAGRRWKRAGAPSGARSRARSDDTAGSAGSGAWSCCSRAKHCSRPSGPCR